MHYVANYVDRVLRVGYEMMIELFFIFLLFRDNKQFRDNIQYYDLN